MDQVLKFTQAYSLTPWRKQTQRIGLFLSALVVCTLIAGVYLNVSARAATLGRQIQRANLRIEVLERDIADRQAKLATLTSSVEMEKIALESGFRPTTADEIIYIVVPGYSGRHAAVLADTTQVYVSGPTTLSPEFTVSLFDWIQKKFSMPVISLGNK